MTSTLIRNIGTIVTGDLRDPLSSASSLYIEGGLIREVGTDRTDADTIVDARGLTLTPGLVDGAPSSQLPTGASPNWAAAIPIRPTTAWN